MAHGRVTKSIPARCSSGCSRAATELLAIVNRSWTHGYPHLNKPYGYEGREGASRGRAHLILPTWPMVLPTTPAVSTPLRGTTWRPVTSNGEHRRNPCAPCVLMKPVKTTATSYHNPGGHQSRPSRGQHAFELQKVASTGIASPVTRRIQRTRSSASDTLRRTN